MVVTSHAFDAGRDAYFFIFLSCFQGIYNLDANLLSKKGLSSLEGVLNFEEWREGILIGQGTLPFYAG